MVTMVIPEPTPTANQWTKRHWSVYYRVRKRWHQLLTDELLRQNLRWLLRGRCPYAALTVVRHAPGALDEDNLVGGMKPVVDVLRAATAAEEENMRRAFSQGKPSPDLHLGLFLDDTPVRFRMDCQQVRSKDRRTELTLELWS